MPRRAALSDQLFRTISPEGKPLPWRKNSGTALRDAVYVLKGWGPHSAGQVKLTIDTRVAGVFADDVAAAGWRFEVTTKPGLSKAGLVAAKRRRSQPLTKA
jgi:hypothetical protein